MRTEISVSLSLWGKAAVALFVMLAFASIGTRGNAQVKPGDFITVQSANKVKDLVSPGVMYKVEKGMSMKIVPSQRIDWPPPYKDATEKYSSQVRLSDDHRSVLGYVAGQPFPLIDANDPTSRSRSSGITCSVRFQATTTTCASSIATANTA